MSAYQPKTGAKCTCRRGQERDNCPQCEGTGWVIDFVAIRARNPVFMRSSYVNPADKARGVIGYSDRVQTCPTTGKATNCWFRTPLGRLVVAYDQAAADATDNAVEGKEVQS